MFENDQIMNEIQIELKDRLNRSEPENDDDTDFYELQTNLYEELLREALGSLRKKTTKN
jgi:hypothetical protein